MSCLWQNNSEAVITMQMKRCTLLWITPEAQCKGKKKNQTTSLGEQRGITEVNVAVPDLSNEGCHKKLTSSGINSTTLFSLASKLKECFS